MISIFCGGGPSQMDLFDDKPLLRKYAGQLFPGKSELKFDNRGGASAIVMPSKWEFSHAGKCGMHINRELLPHFSNIVDDVTLIRFDAFAQHSQSRCRNASDDYRPRARWLAITRELDRLRPGS